MVDYIDQHREFFGVVPICSVLQVAPSTYYAAKARPPSRRQLRDDVIGVVVMQLREEFGQEHGTIQRIAEQLRCGVELLSQQNMPPETRFRDAHTHHRGGTHPHREKTSQPLQRSTEPETARAQHFVGG